VGAATQEKYRVLSLRVTIYGLPLVGVFGNGLIEGIVLRVRTFSTVKPKIYDRVMTVACALF
jgi:hypothetical protein